MILVHLSSGKGPGECQLAVCGLALKFVEEAQDRGLLADVIEQADAEHGPTSVLFSLAGAEAVQFAESWQGSIKWICPSPLRPGWARKNWFVGVRVVTPRPGSSSLRAEDVRFETLRASGPGGQHVNKTESAVRATHTPSGISVLARDQRSQHRNKALALARLEGLLASREQMAAQQAEQNLWEGHQSLERGNPSRTYVGTDFRRSR